MKPPSIPRRTRAELTNPAAPGERHQQARGVIFSLVGQGFCGNAVFAQVRGMYALDFKDSEIWNLIRGAERKNPPPSGHRTRYHHSPAVRPTQAVTAQSACAAAERLLKGFRCEEADLWNASPWRPLEDPAFDALLIFAGLFHGDDLVNLCPEHGVGITKRRDEWLTHVRKHGAPSGNLGCMFRPNPVSGIPTGEKGGWTDADVTAHRFSVVESDILPLDLQLSVLARLPLPIAAIIFSGSKSYHALVQVDAADALVYRRDVGRMFASLRLLGFDQSTGNPSRMSRLPGAWRGQEQQRLVYLNPDAAGETPILGDKNETR